jgi:uncharacterized membrane protein YfcA
MVTAKFLWNLGDMLGIPGAILGIIANLDNIKSTILAVLLIIYFMIRLYYLFVEKKQAARKRDYELWNLEMDKQERADKMKKASS